ncbi:dockerin type I repeat-containing protein [Ruminococcus sp.]|uniref:dockerin type I repeat-containing protein n=1 Tax=Ruminococcus sp. TaxID=41978 RepID=UPI0025E74203|nr:dockerin type I repeat-containing protein [Ruminococcus sp.]MCR4639055.1 dockerin type I repeat-containing protein [Ruminococcus sp.]
MRSKKALLSVASALMAAACMLPFPATAADSEAAVTAVTDTAIDLSESISSNTTIDNYEFYCPEYFLIYGSKMKASTNGRFSGEYKAPPYPLNGQYAEFSSMYKFGEGNEPNVGKKQNIRADYCLNNRLNGKYGIFFDAMITENTENHDRCYFDVAEMVSGYEPEDFLKTFELKYGTNHLDLKSCELLKSYSSGGHEYDLYKGVYHYYGCYSNYDEYRYIAFRKDYADGEQLENSIDLYDHMSRLSEFENADTKIGAMSLIFRTIETEGDFEVTKQDISVIEQSTVPEVISGDFNSDKRIDSMDVVHARKTLLKHMSSEGADTPEYADINLNGKFDVADIVMLQSFVIGRIKAFPASE